jgi:hypothetical protein
MLARHTASYPDQLFVEAANRIHEIIEPICLSAISLTHSLFLE